MLAVQGTQAHKQTTLVAKYKDFICTELDGLFSQKTKHDNKRTNYSISCFLVSLIKTILSMYLLNNNRQWTGDTKGE